MGGRLSQVPVVIKFCCALSFKLDLAMSTVEAIAATPDNNPFVVLSAYLITTTQCS
jgi:hypothetical protein